MHKGWKSEVPDPLAPGSTVIGIASVLNMPNTITWTVEEASNSALAISGTGMAGAKVRIRFGVEPAGEGTLLTVTTGFEGQMVVGAIAGAIERAARVDIDQSLENLAGLVA
jgi:carbon monoxide dehydrogenase subunit G